MKFVGVTMCCKIHTVLFLNLSGIQMILEYPNYEKQGKGDGNWAMGIQSNFF